ncbi:MAG: TIGR02611 family protein [Micrococcales bacterium]|nr:TIGR02611 family protein [Micrococcales bacterium]
MTETDKDRVADADGGATAARQGVESILGSDGRPEARWGWQRGMRANPATRTTLHLGVGTVGLLIVVLGLILVPFPGPGWAIVIFGVWVWSLEFVWAARLFFWAKATLRRWNDWVMAQPLWVRGLIVLGTLILVWAFFYVWFRLTGIPGFVPDFAEEWLDRVPGLDRG